MVREARRRTGTAIRLALLTLLAAVASPAERNGREVSSQDESLVFSPESVEWSPGRGTPGFVKGAKKASLGFDPKSGGETYYAKFPAGSHFELHWV